MSKRFFFFGSAISGKSPTEGPDGHTRITKMENGMVGGGTQEEHEKLQEIGAKIDSKSPIDDKVLVKAGLVRRVLDGIRLLGKGELKTKISLEVSGATKKAIEAVEKAGGSVKILSLEPSAGKQ